MSEFWKTLSTEMEKRNIRQVDLARELGIPRDTIQSWRKGLSEPPGWVQRLLFNAIAAVPPATKENRPKDSPRSPPTAATDKQHG